MHPKLNVIVTDKSVLNNLPATGIGPDIDGDHPSYGNGRDVYVPDIKRVNGADIPAPHLPLIGIDTTGPLGRGLLTPFLMYADEGPDVQKIYTSMRHGLRPRFITLRTKRGPAKGRTHKRRTNPLNIIVIDSLSEL